MSETSNQIIAKVDALLEQANELKKFALEQLDEPAPTLEQKVETLTKEVEQLAASMKAKADADKEDADKEDDEKSAKAKTPFGAEKEDDEKSEKAKGKKPAFGGKQAPPFGQKPGDGDGAEGEDEEDDEEKGKKKSSKAEGEEDDEEEKAKKLSPAPAIPWPSDMATPEFRKNVAKAHDPLRDWGRDSVK